MARSRFVSTLLAVAAFALVWVAPTSAKGGIDAALEWLRLQQQGDGGFSNGFSPESDLGMTADAVVAMAAVGESAEGWVVDGSSPLDFLEARAQPTSPPGLTAKLVLAVIAAGRDPRDFGDVNLMDRLNAGFDPSSGLYGGAFDSALAVLALHAAGDRIPDEAVAALTAARLPDGSYAFDAGQTPGSGDSNTTALAVQALLAAGAEAEAAESIDYFRSTQNPDGGWTYQKPSAFGEATDANSTALVVQALMAAGEDLDAWGQPLGVLVSLQQPSGAFAFNAEVPADNILATVQALPALAGVDLTEIAGLAAPAAAPAGGPSAVAMAIAAAAIVVGVLAVAGLVGRRTN